MKIKAKLTLGVGLLFALILLLAIVGVRQVYRLSDDTKNILHANYQSLDYSKNMLHALEATEWQPLFAQFEANLAKQERNITEVGETEQTRYLREYFERFKTDPADTVAVHKIRNQINSIMKLNLEAIQRKSAVAEKTAESAIFWLSILGICCFLIAFTLLFNLPAHIANPIRELTESIKQIAAGNYLQRVHLESHSEFGELARSFNVMAEKLEEYDNSNLARLMIEKKRIETLINNMHDPIIGLDEEKNVLFANEVALKITGLKPREMIGKSALELSVTNDLIRSLLKGVVSGAKTADLEPQQPMKIYANGKESYFEKNVLDISITPTGEKTSKHIGYVILLRNVTAYKELDFAKTNFIATLSHEFKTPIASIKMSVQILENKRTGPLNDEQNNLLLHIRDDADRLLKITGELLNITQVETGKIQVTALPTDAKAILLQAVEATRNLADQKNIRFDLNYPEDLPAVLADSDKTTWVLTNLISNAVHYSYQNSIIFLSIRTPGNQVEFVVKDTGKGIPPQYIDKVFDRYFRIPGPTSEGTGLGLAISKEFIEAQGGSIAVDSDFGAGSTFTVKLNGVEQA